MVSTATPAGAAHTASFPWRAVALGLASAGVAVAVFVWTDAIVAGELLLLTALAASGRVLRAIRDAAEVELTPSALIARPTLGRARCVPWASITELLHTPSPVAPRRVRILASEHQVVVTRRLSHFPQLCEELRARAPHAAVTSSTLLRR